MFLKFKILFPIFVFAFSFNSCKKEALVDPSANNIPDINDVFELESKTDRPGVAFLFFYAVWNEPCAKIRPIVEELALDDEFKEVYFAEIDFEDNRGIAQYYSVRGFPTILIYKNGLERGRFQGGNHPKEDIVKLLRDALK